MTLGRPAGREAGVGMSSKRKVPPTSRTHDAIGFDPALDPQRIGHWSQVFMRAPYSLFAQPQYEQPGASRADRLRGVRVAHVEVAAVAVATRSDDDRGGSDNFSVSAGVVVGFGVVLFVEIGERDDGRWFAWPIGAAFGVEGLDFPPVDQHQRHEDHLSPHRPMTVSIVTPQISTDVTRLGRIAGWR